MKIKEAYQILTDKLNKSSTNFGQMIEYHVAVRAINEAQSYWYDTRLKVAESNLNIQRELQSFIKQAILNKVEITNHYIAYELPDDYYLINQIIVTAYKKNCILQLDTFFTENANSEELFLNADFTPDFEWQQTLATIKNNHLIVFKKDFEIDVKVDYFKQLRGVDIASDYIHLNNEASVDIDLEFEGSNAYEILTIAAQIISGNNSDPVYQIHNNTIKEFN